MAEPASVSPARRIAVRLAALAAACAPVSHAASPEAAQPSPLLAFEVLGCSKADFETPEVAITRLPRGNRVTFVVRHVQGCGRDASSDPTFAVGDGVLKLDYKLYSSDGSVTMCLCEYWARFTFDELMMLIRNVRFRDAPAQYIWND